VCEACSAAIGYWLVVPLVVTQKSLEEAEHEPFADHALNGSYYYLVDGAPVKNAMVPKVPNADIELHLLSSVTGLALLSRRVDEVFVEISFGHKRLPTCHV